MKNNLLFLTLTLLVLAGGGYLIAQFISPESTPVVVNKPKGTTSSPSVAEETRTSARSIKDLKLDKRTNVKPDAPEDTEATKVAAREIIDEKFKNFREEGRKNFEEAVGGNWNVFRKVVETNPEIQELWRQQRELRDKWGTMTDAEKPAALEQMTALRDKGLSLIKVEMSKPENTASAAAPANPNAPAEASPPPEPTAEGPAPNAPAPTVIQ